MPAEMKSPKKATETLTERFLELSRIYSGISGQIYNSNIKRPHKALYGILYPVALAFGLLALCAAAWYGYAFLAAVAVSFALIITKHDERNEEWRKGQTQPGAEQAGSGPNRTRTEENSLSLDY
jgi:hypothetical protein